MHVGEQALEFYLSNKKPSFYFSLKLILRVSSSLTPKSYYISQNNVKKNDVKYIILLNDAITFVNEGNSQLCFDIKCKKLYPRMSAIKNVQYIQDNQDIICLS